MFLVSTYLKEDVAIEYYALGRTQPLLASCARFHHYVVSPDIVSWETKEGDIPSASGGKKVNPLTKNP